jgi:hypothetical protein
MFLSKHESKIKQSLFVTQYALLCVQHFHTRVDDCKFNSQHYLNKQLK